MRWQYQQSTKGVHLNKSTDHTGQLIIAPTTGQVLPSALQLSCKAGTEGMSRERIYLDIPHTVRQNAFMSHSEMITC